MRHTGIALFVVLLASSVAAASEPERPKVMAVHAGFVVENLVTADVPTCMAFLPDGSFLVGEKRGRVYRVKHGVKQEPPLWSAEPEVLNALDRGLLGIAVDPQFATNLSVYFLYVVDPDTNSIDGSGFGFGRLVRYRMAGPDSNALDPGSRAILMGVDRARGPLVGHGSHTVGALRFGADGSLLVSIGDGANFNTADAGGLDSAAFGPGAANPAEDIGAFRAQDRNSLCGKILRLDPATGHGLPDNPYFDGDPTSVASRVWQYGLRNPFRFSVRPGTGSATPGAAHPGTLYIGDVGWNAREELNIAGTPGMNFGWPCYEGPQPSGPYQSATPPHHGCATLPPAPVMTPPLLHWRQNPSEANPLGVVGTCVIDGLFYTGHLYPSEFRGAHFFSDYGYSWIKVARFDDSDQVQSVTDFASYVGEVVDFASDPVTGDVHFVSVLGSIARIRYNGPANQRPTANASAEWTDGRAPLDIAFTSAGSFDPGGGPISFAWAFGDGQTSAEPDPTHTFAGGGTFAVVLTVQDSDGWIARDTVVVTVAGPDPFPATAVRDRFSRADGPLGGEWLESAGSHVIQDGAVMAGSGASQAVWGAAVFASEQEVFATMRALPAGGRCALLLKVQGASLSGGGVEVRYDAAGPRVEVIEHAAGSAGQIIGTRTGITLAAGDRFGARAYADGSIDVFRNSNRIGGFLIAPGPLRTQSGRIGFAFDAAGGARLDDVGGGTLLEAGRNSRPVATLDSPPPDAFRAPGDTVWLKGAGTDAEDPDSLLRYEWSVDLHHGTHVHPDYFVSDLRETFFVLDEHSTGADFEYRVRLSVTDLAGGRDEVMVHLYLAIDVSAGAIDVTPVPAGSAAPFRIEGWLRNLSGVDARPARWQIRIDSTLVGEGDVTIARRDSVKIAADVPAGVPPGTRVVQVACDVLDAILEPDETNNVRERDLIVVPGSGPDRDPPGFAPAPGLEIHASFAVARWGTDEPAFGTVRFGATPSLAESVVTLEATAHEARLDRLVPGARYYYRVIATDPSGNAAVAAMDSFVTTTGTLDAAQVPVDRLELYAASRNPTPGPVRFALMLPRPAPVELRVFDALGREIWARREAAMSAGRREIEWPGIDAAGAPVHPGLYLIHIRAEDRRWQRRVAIVR